ncbi:hypothetical protein OHS18_13175 [Amycolatopsis sp. NBC_00355]|uniref:hypothetical protein n=1 Tax=Amycolatopsis sp. NBC_00355 TaxID=2975957 RepID=UPI002E2661FB
MRKLFTRLLATVGTFGSIITLVIQLRQPALPLTAWQWGLLGILALSTVVSLALDMREFFTKRHLVIATNVGIKQYMYNWIERGATAAIFSRNLGWAEEDARVAELLRLRARSHSLTVVLPRETPLSRELARLGAEVFYYPDINYTIRTRFTIIDADRSDTRVAIGRFVDDDLVVDEYDSGSDPAFHLARDLFELVRRLIASRG